MTFTSTEGNSEGEDDIYFDSEGEDQVVDQADYYQDAAEEDVLDTPEKKYKAAKDSIGFDDYYAIDTFYEVYCDENAREKLRRKSLKKAAITLSQHDEDIERILGALTDIFQAQDDKLFDKEDLFEVVTGMLSHLMKNNSAFETFLEAATKKVNKETNESFFIDLKLRQCELMMMNQDFEKAKEYMADVEPMLYFPPKPDDLIMRSSCIRFLTIKIEFADIFDKEDVMIDLYNQASQINLISLSTNQTAILTKIEGIIQLKNRNFKEAKNKFFKAFELFDEIGSYKRVHCIPYCALSEMLSHGLMSLFMDPKVIPFKQHEKVAAFEQLSSAYLDNDILRYNKLIEPASKHFTDSYYHDLILEIRLFVLRGAVKKFLQAYQRLDLSFAAENLGSTKEEVKAQVLDLILSKEIRALIDPENEFIIVSDLVRPSKYLLSTNSIIESMEASVARMSNEIQIDY